MYTGVHAHTCTSTTSYMQIQLCTHVPRSQQRRWARWAVPEPRRARDSRSKSSGRGTRQGLTGLRGMTRTSALAGCHNRLPLGGRVQWHRLREPPGAASDSLPMSAPRVQHRVIAEEGPRFHCGDRAVRGWRNAATRIATTFEILRDAWVGCQVD